LPKHVGAIVKSKRNIQLSAFVGLSFIYSIMHGIGTKTLYSYFSFGVNYERKSPFVKVYNFSLKKIYSMFSVRVS
jgi:hypothetical protein